MCGFVAIHHADQKYLFDKDSLGDMAKAISNRGPDETGVKIGPSFAMAHNRLSIVDISAGQQPMMSSCGVFSIVFNGEIYNYQELRAQMEREGVLFNTKSDTEVLLNGYKHWGAHVVEKLNGMFAFAVWDSENETMFVARDRYGIKPLFFMEHENGETIFASDISSLEARHDVSLPLCLSSIDSYLTLGYVVGSKTFYENVFELEPGYSYTISSTKRSKQIIQYWDVESVMNRAPEKISVHDGVEMLTSSVVSQSMGDVPVGSFLSGGLDSTLICNVYVNENSGALFNTYSAGFDKPEYDELDDAAAAAGKIGAIHHGKRFRFDQIRGQDEVLNAFSTPFADNAALPMIHLSKMAKKDITVAFSGDGADELFFGYRNHKLLKIERALSGVFPSCLLSSFAVASSGFNCLSKVSAISRVIAQSLPDAYISAMSFTSKGVRDSLYSMSMKSAINGNRIEDYFSGLVSKTQLEDPMKVIQMLDMKTYLPGSVLTKVDRATMASGIEARVPYLDNTMVNAVLPQKVGTNLSMFQNKKQLRSWAGKVMGENASKQKKKSFTSPLDRWYREVSFDEIYRSIVSEAFLDSGIFNVDTVRYLIEDHHAKKSNNGNILWSLSLLTSFLNRREAIKGIRTS